MRDENKPERPATTQPRWVRVIDWLTVVALIMAACVFAFGGFRAEVVGIPISVRSGNRVLLVAVLLTFFRHARVRTPVMPRLVGAQLARWWRLEGRREVWPAFVATRLGVLVAAYLGVVTIGVVPGSERFRVSENEFLNLMARWDAQWYFRIITEGYQWDGNPNRQQNVVFFPAFPAVTRVVGLLLFGREWLLAGLLLALTAFFAALLYLYRLARDVLEPDRARTAIWALAAYPFSVYFSAPYTEGFYLLGAVATFYHVVRGQWWRAALWGLFVGLCRPNGFLIALPVGILVLQRVMKERRLVLAAWAPVLAPIFGILTYSFFLYVRFGDFLAWQKGQRAWGRVYVGLWPSVTALWRDRYNIVANEGLYYYTVTDPYDLMHTAAALFVLISVWPTIRRFGLAYGVFSAATILPPILIGGMMSIGRMTSVLFPAFLWVGAILPPRYAPALIAFFCLLQGLVAVLFFTWRPVF